MLANKRLSSRKGEKAVANQYKNAVYRSYIQGAVYNSRAINLMGGRNQRKFVSELFDYEIIGYIVKDIVHFVNAPIAHIEFVVGRERIG